MSEVNTEDIVVEDIVVDVKISKPKKEELKLDHPEEFQKALNEVKSILSNTEINLFNLSYSIWQF